MNIDYKAVLWFGGWIMLVAGVALAFGPGHGLILAGAWSIATFVMVLDR